jgi:hypothetical protein
MWPFRRTKRPNTEAHDAGSALRVLTVLSPQQQAACGGIPNEAIAGWIEGSFEPLKALANGMFRVNPLFVDFMQNVIRTFGPEDEGLQQAVHGQPTGSLGIIDLRTPEGPDGRVPLEDIVGMFAVHDGKLAAYHPNDKHLVFSKHGLVQLPPPFAEIHVRELMRLKV